MSLTVRYRIGVAGAVLVLILVGCPPAKPQSDLYRAKQILQHFIQDERAATTPSQHEAIRTALPEIGRRVQMLVINGLLMELNEPKPETLERLQNQLKFLDDEGITLVGPPENGKYLIYFSVETCAICSRSWIGILSKTGNHYVAEASIDNKQPDQLISVLPLPLSREGKLRLLVRAENWGDPHHRLSLSAYALGDHGLNLFWSLSGLFYGTMEIRNDRLTVTHTVSLNPSSKLLKETYMVTETTIEPEGNKPKD